MKILLLTAWYPSASCPVEGVFVREQARVIARNHEVHVVAFYLQDRTPYIEESIEEGLTVTRIWQRQPSWPAKVRYLWRIWKLTRRIQNIIRAWGCPDIIHAHTYQAGVPAVWLGRRNRLPVVITEHWSGFARGQLTYMEKLKARYAFSRADLVMPVSDYLKRAIESYGLRAHFQVAHNVADIKLFYPPDDSAGTSSPKLKLLNVAVQIPVKNIPILLNAARLLKSEGVPFNLDIVGDGPQLNEYKKLAGALKISEQVKFWGYQTKDQIAILMRQADLFILPSQVEMLPCALIEAMASGLPAVASRVGGIPELVTEHTGTLVSPNDPEALKEGILRAWKKRGEFDRQAIARQARDRFSQEAVGKILDEVYSRLTQTQRNIK
ncbi:MAG: glycosyltransferase [Calditrichota bacterium]